MTPADPTRLVRPASEHLPAYVAALRRGFEPSPLAGRAAAADHLARIETDPAGFLAALEDPAAQGGPLAAPDGRPAAPLSGFVRWIWSDGFCGVLNIRWQPGTAALPEHVLGHVGCVVAPWRRRQGHATRALALLLAELPSLGLPHVELTTGPANEAAIRVIEANRGIRVERFRTGPVHGGAEGLRFRIALD